MKSCFNKRNNSLTQSLCMPFFLLKGVAISIVSVTLHRGVIFNHLPFFIRAFIIFIEEIYSINGQPEFVTHSQAQILTVRNLELRIFQSYDSWGHERAGLWSWAGLSPFIPVRNSHHTQCVCVYFSENCIIFRQHWSKSVN